MTVEVIQADRDAAADYCSRLKLSSFWVQDIRAGREDPNYTVQAFARHRLSTTTRVDATDGEREACAKIADRQAEPGAWAHEAASDCARLIAARIRARGGSRQPAAEAAALPDPSKLSPETVEKLAKMEQANAAGSHAVRNMLLGSGAPAEADEVGRLREALESAVTAIEAGDLYAAMCCSGYDCGCRGSSNADLLVHDLRGVLARTALNRADNAEGGSDLLDEGGAG